MQLLDILVGAAVDNQAVSFDLEIKLPDKPLYGLQQID